MQALLNGHSDGHWKEALTVFTKEHAKSCQFIGVYGEEKKRAVTTLLASELSEFNRTTGHDQHAIEVADEMLNSVRILLRERIAVEQLLTPKMLLVYVEIAAKHFATSENALRCINNSILNNQPLVTAAFSDPASPVGPALLLLLQAPLSFASLSLLCRVFVHTLASCEAFAKNMLGNSSNNSSNSEEPTLSDVVVATLAWAVRSHAEGEGAAAAAAAAAADCKGASQLPLWRSHARLSCCEHLLQLLFAMAALSPHKTAAGGAAGAQSQATMTQLGFLVSDILLLPDHPAQQQQQQGGVVPATAAAVASSLSLFPLKMKAVTLLLHMPDGFGSFLLQSRALRPLLRILRWQLQRPDGNPAEDLTPVLSAIYRACSTAADRGGGGLEQQVQAQAQGQAAAAAAAAASAREVRAAVAACVFTRAADKRWAAAAAELEELMGGLSPAARARVLKERRVHPPHVRWRTSPAANPALADSSSSSSSASAAAAAAVPADYGDDGDDGSCCYGLPAGGDGGGEGNDSSNSSNSSSSSSGGGSGVCVEDEEGLAALLVGCMTGMEGTSKRVVSELLLLLCDSQDELFVQRTGFGNAVYLLRCKAGMMG